MKHFYLLLILGFSLTSSLNAEGSSETYSVWNNDVVTLDIIEKHLRISPVRTVTDPEQLNREEVIAIWETSKKVASILEQVFGTRHYFEHTPVHHDGCQFYTEIIPVDGTSESVDLAAKIYRSIYVVSGGLYDSCQLTDNQIERIQAIAKDILSKPAVVPGRREDNPGSWKVSWKNIHLARKIVRDALDSHLNPQFLASTDSEKTHVGTSKTSSIEGEFDTVEKSDRLVREITSCVFCRQDVIDKQRIIDGKWHHLVPNNRPYIPEKHLMTISQEHCLSREHFREEEVWEEHQLFVKVGKAFQTMFGKGISYCRFTQNGFYTGQTIPHPHTHFLAGTGKEGLNFLLEKALRELEGRMEPPLDSDEMGRIIKKYRLALQNV